MSLPTPAPVAASTSTGSWEATFLQDLGAPLNATNITAVNLWAQSEGVQSSNNWLAASGKGPGATTCLSQCGTSSPVYAYDTPADGAAFDAQFLKTNNYADVISAFAGTADNGTSPDPTGLANIFAAINQSGWCRGCEGGQYPVALYDALSKSTAQLTSLWGDIKQGVGAAISNAIPGSSIVGGASGVVSGIQSVYNLATDLTSAKFWDRILLFAGGLLLAIFGSIIFFETTKTGQTVTSEAAQAGAIALA